MQGEGGVITLYNSCLLLDHDCRNIEYLVETDTYVVKDIISRLRGIYGNNDIIIYVMTYTEYLNYTWPVVGKGF